jgi:tRNA dimethylallyltransferase
MKHPLVVIVGQTASGKTALALELARRFDGEIICADSRTVYKGMDIGTAKPSVEEQQGIPHHLLDLVEPGERFTAVDFKRLATEAIQDIEARGKLPIMAGGTGLYVDAVLYDFQFDSAGAERDPVNPRHLKQSERPPRRIRPNTLVIGLQLDKETLEQRIEARVEAMLAHGLIDEAKALKAKYDTSKSAFDTTSYRPILEYLEGKISLDEAKRIFVKNDLHLAKRQKTWFKRNPDIHWVSGVEQVVELATTFLNKSGR